ncbi:MAG: efflux RND transporter permease subunit [Muribaculaceae bacterium]|nr:efflux RND transporter permease subunit [Roseburia sp.]MCM1432038.1 efflux RND transporter permease subunit [Muribaculaceae bacterium]MCM1493910.1 efflux RND transporter permease subunit [Muribaculaceae bacterium]
MISKYSVKRPFTVLVCVVLVIVLGVVSLMRMTTDLLPDMSFQYALIITTDVGASPEKVESEVTAPIEASMATTSNIKNVSSISYNSYSIVTCEYEQSANMDSVVIEIQQKLDQISGGWGDSVGTPMIMKINPDMLPVLVAAVDIEGMSAGDLSDYVETDLIPSLESLEGVASVSATGQLEESVEVTLNADKIKKLNKKIRKAIDKQFKDAQKDIDNAASEVEDGQNALNSGSDTLTQSINDVLDKRDELFKSEEDLNKQKKDLNKQKKSLEQLQAGISAFMESEAYTGLTGLIEQNPQALQMPEVQEQVAALNAVIAEQFAGLSELGIEVKTYEDLPTAAATVAGLLTQVNSGIETIDSALEQIEQGKITLSNALDTLNANAALAAIQMSSSSAELVNAASSLENAQSSLDEARDSAYEASDVNEILSTDTIKSLFAAQNFDMPAGYVMDGDIQYLVRVGDSVKNVQELSELVLIDMNMDGVDVIRLSDVADIATTDNSDETYAIINGNPGITLSLEKQTGYSTGEVTDRILDKFDSLTKDNDKLHLTTLMDQGVYIDMIVDSVVQNMIWGAVLAILVLLFFLKDIKPTLVIACSIPLSVIVAVVLMYFTGITMNIISMSGLLLGIGMLVDNSIVVIENIYRLRDEGLSIKKAAVEGAGQVAGAIVASTLTTVSVYAPIIFTDGITRQLFVDLALTIAFTLVASLLVALTFVPAMSTATLKRTREIRHPFFDRMKDVYGSFLNWCLRFKPVVFVVAVALLAGSYFLAMSRGMTFMDMDMQTNQLSVTIVPPEGETYTFEELKDASTQVLEKISDIEGVDTIASTIGGNSTMSLMSGGSNAVSMYLLLDEESGVGADDVAKEIEERTKDLSYVVTAGSSSMDFSAYFGEGLSINIAGSDLETLQSLAASVAEIVENTEGTMDVEDGLDDATPQLSIRVDKEKAAEYGLTVAQVFQLVYAEMAEESSATTISTDIKDYEVYLQTEEQANPTLSDIKKLTFTHTNEDGGEEELPLTDICEMENTTTLSTIQRDSQTRYLTVSCAIDGEHNVTLVADAVQEELDRLDIPEGYTVEMAGEDETIGEAMSQLVLMLVLAVIFIYLIMVAQFQSLLSPFIIMFSIPLAFTGGFIALFITGQEVSIIAMLGFIMLAGLIVNNGIVLIDYINQARREGESKKDAIMEAGKTRLRPILMTALTTILAMSTSALSGNEGAQMMKPMAITIIGGMIYGTLLTLIVIPCIYDAFNRERSMVEEEL